MIYVTFEYKCDVESCQESKMERHYGISVWNKGIAPTLPAGWFRLNHMLVCPGHEVTLKEKTDGNAGIP